MRTLGHPNEANPMAPTVRLNPLEHIFPDWTNSVRALRFPWICLTISMISSCLDIGAGWDLLDFMNGEDYTGDDPVKDNDDEENA